VLSSGISMSIIFMAINSRIMSGVILAPPILLQYIRMIGAAQRLKAIGDAQ
jgi:hypothetical protein